MWHAPVSTSPVAQAAGLAIDAVAPAQKRVSLLFFLYSLGLWMCGDGHVVFRSIALQKLMGIRHALVCLFL